jgi:hypothetical protein
MAEESPFAWTNYTKAAERCLGRINTDYTGPKSMLIKILSLSFLIAFGAEAATNDREGSATEIQHRINAAANGAVVKIPAGSFTWERGITIEGKGVTLEGEGQGVTTIRNASGHSLISVSCGSRSSTRITGLTLLGDHAVAISGSKASAPYRVDHCTFDDGTTAQAILVEVRGNGPGLIDQCKFVAGAASEMIHNYGMGAENTSGWSDEVIPGSAAAVYIEDCIFSKNPLADQYFWGTAAIQSYYGARTVMRYCQLNYCHIDQHGNKPPLYGARWWEFYNNTFSVPPNGNQSNYFALRGGSGVVFNNHVSGGPNAGAGQIQLYSNETINPPLCGPGAGIFVNGNRSNSPVYIWGNDAEMEVVSGSSNAIAGRDFLVSATQPARLMRYQQASDNSTTTYSYTPFEYPHPLRRGDANQKSTVERSTSR